MKGAVPPVSCEEQAPQAIVLSGSIATTTKKDLKGYRLDVGRKSISPSQSYSEGLKRWCLLLCFYSRLPESENWR